MDHQAFRDEMATLAKKHGVQMSLHVYDGGGRLVIGGFAETREWGVILGLLTNAIDQLTDSAAFKAALVCELRRVRPEAN